MDIRRRNELDAAGTGLTDDEVEHGWHWCPEWDYLLVGPGDETALVCSCGIPAIERWKQSDEAEEMVKRHQEYQDALFADGTLDDETLKNEADENNEWFRRSTDGE